MGVHLPGPRSAARLGKLVSPALMCAGSLATRAAISLSGMDRRRLRHPLRSDACGLGEGDDQAVEVGGDAAHGPPSRMNTPASSRSPLDVSGRACR